MSEPATIGQTPRPSSTPLQYVSLPHKPSVKIAVKWLPAKESSSPMSEKDVIVVFINGLMTTNDSWGATLDQFVPTAPKNVSFLCYDRYGQGATTDHDPADEEAEDPKHGHDLTSTTEDLGYLVSHFTGQETSTPGGPKVVLVGNSIGGAIIRLYAQTYPATVAGVIILDSVIANTDFVGIFPDPDAPGFNVSSLPEGITAEGLRKVRQQMAIIFHPTVGSREGLSRKNLGQLLPHGDKPKLVGWSTNINGQRGPYVTVVGHGWEEFATQTARQMGITEVYSQHYTNPFWWEYNKEICKISDPERVKGPIEAVGAGHFIQKDKPELVVEELKEIIGKVESL